MIGDSANRLAGVVSTIALQTSAVVAGRKAAVRMHAVLLAAMVATLALVLSTSARAATIIVDSLADTGAPGICVLRDAITAANTRTATNGCVAGDDNDTIRFSVTGKIALASTLPQVTDNHLTITGPAAHGITIDGSGRVQVMQVGSPSASGTTLNLNNLIIARGFSGGDGGGIFNEATLNVTNSTFFDNRARGDGGGIENDGKLSVTNSTFSGNRATIAGGIDNGEGATLTVTNSTFSDNGSGGGIFNEATLTVANSTFSDNRGWLEGGGIENNGTLTVTNSTFSGNSAEANGGGIDNNFGTLTVTNSTFSDNSARTGGGIENENGALTVTNSTFSGNSASFKGGGIYEFESTTSLKSTILAGSSSGGNCSGTITDAGYSISDDNTCRFSAATGSRNNTDPQLDPAGLANNGGPTKTIALTPGSPAIDAIPVANCTDQARTHNPIITDQRLFPRPDTEENRCDIGAYEFADTSFIPFARFNGSLTIDSATGVLHLNGRFKLGMGGSIDPTAQPVAFSVGKNALRLRAGSFVQNATGYIYQNVIGHSFLRISIQFTNTPGSYRLLVYQQGGPQFTTPTLVTLTIGDDSGSTLMNATFP